MDRSGPFHADSQSKNDGVGFDTFLPGSVTINRSGTSEKQDTMVGFPMLLAGWVVVALFAVAIGSLVSWFLFQY